ncbi:MAG: alpha/beta hydrolase [Candidatus Izemoplasmataceae bacterium]
MIHIYKEGFNNHTLLLLHGTGGNENDLLNIAKYIDDEANVLSLRGDVSENGLNRFFKRLSEGVFDEDDLKYRTQKLHKLLDDLSNQYGFDRANVTVVGYSNGANIAASLLFHYKDVLKRAILLHPMVPLRNIEIPSLEKTSILITAGTNDPICPVKESEELFELLNNANGDVEISWFNFGHRLTEQEVFKAKEWFDKKEMTS